MTTTIVAQEGQRVADKDRLGELYERHAPGGIRLAYLLTGQQASAEDLFHDAFIRAAARIGAMRDPGAFAGYLRRTIVNLHASRLRRVKLERAHAKQEAGVPVTTSPAPSGEVEDRHVVWEALQALPARQRAVIVLRYYEDQTEAATADALGCSVAAVKSLTQRAMAALRDHLGGDDDA